MITYHKQLCFFVDVFRDCIRFCFMDVLQTQLDEVRTLWNTHLMRKSRKVTGVPDELFYIPDIQGW